MRFLAALAIALVLAFAAVPAGAVEILDPDPDALTAAFVKSLKRCAAGGRLTVGVLGFPRSFTGLSDDERVATRRIVEALIARQPGVLLKPVADLDKLIAGRMNAGGHDPADIAAIFDKARDVTALVHFEGRRSASEFALTLVGATRAGAGPAAGAVEPFHLKLDAGPALVDVVKLVETEFAERIKADQAIAEIVVETFRPEGGTPYSRCNDTLTGLVVDVLARLNADPDFALRDRRIAVRVARPGEPAAAGAAILSGSFGSDAAGLWLSASLATVDGRALARVHRAHITGLACDARPLGFLENIAAGALADTGRLEVSAARGLVPVGDFLSFRIRGGDEARTLYCWALASDRTAFVFLPTPGREAESRLAAGATRDFPEDFDFGPIVAAEPSENLFGCFAAAGPLSAEASGAWSSKYGPVGRAKDGALDEAEIDELLALMRREPGIVEAYGAVRIVP